MSNAHKGQIVPMKNQMIPIDKTTTFHANYDYDLNGFNQGDIVRPIGPESSYSFQTNAFVQLGNDNRFANKGSFTLNAWVYAREYSGGVIVKGDVGGWANNDYGIRHTGGNAFKFYISPNNSTLVIGLDFEIPLGEWVHISAVADKEGNEMRVYINSVQVGSAVYNVAPIDKGRDLIIGKGYTTTFFDGLISELSFYSRALTVQEVKEVMEKGPTSNQKNLEGYWKLNEKEGPVAYEASGSGFDGVWNGNITPGPGLTSATIQEGKFQGAALIEEGTVNLYNSDISGLKGITYGYIGVENGYRKYSISGTWNEGTYPYSFSLGSYPYKKSLSYSISCYLYTNVPHKFVEKFGIISIVNDPGMTGLRREIREGNYSAREDFIHSTDWNNAAYVYSQPIANGTTFDPSTDFLYVKDVQIEQKPYATSYVKTVRPPGNLQYPNPLENQTDFTISLWAKQLQLPGERKSILCIQRPGMDRDGVFIDFYYNSLRAFVYPTDGAAFIATTTDFDLGKWSHITVVGTSNLLKLYVDGKLKFSQAITSPYKIMGVLSLGRKLSEPPYNDIAKVLVDELRIESRAISDEEVQAWAASGLHYNYLDYSQYVD